MAAAAQSGDEEIVGINVTPLVDVVLVLLVVLMVTAGYIAKQAIPVELPRAATGETVPETLALFIDRDGAYYAEGTRLEPAALRRRIAAARRAQPALKAVIAADGRARHRQVIRLIDLLRQEHVGEFAFDVRPEDVAQTR